MIIRVDKCSTFGIKKAISKSVQYLPKLLINNRLIPTVKTGESFEYLGRYFDFNMSNDKHKAELTTLVNELLTDIDSKPLHPKNKLLLYICDFSYTTVTYYRNYLGTLPLLLSPKHGLLKTLTLWLINLSADGLKYQYLEH